MQEESFPQQVRKMIQRVPPGKVATYGQIARLLGRPRAAREVGWALRDLPDGVSTPWQRVINAQGRISFPEGSEGHSVQRALLEAEGIVFEPDGWIELKTYGWEGLDPVERHVVVEGETAEPPPQQLTLGI